MVKVKICGIRSLVDALEAVAAGADALGFVFYRASRRYVAPEMAGWIIRQLPERVKKVGVFVNARAATIKRYARQCSLDMVQLHGNESARTCSQCAPVPVIKAFCVGKKFDAGVIEGYNTFGFLFDAHVPGKAGGSGKTFDWSLIKTIPSFRMPSEIFLSGGLNARNVSKAIRMVRPQWVDASSSLELFPGKKDRRKMVAFVKAVKHTAIVP